MIKSRLFIFFIAVCVLLSTGTFLPILPDTVSASPALLSIPSPDVFNKIYPPNGATNIQSIGLVLTWEASNTPNVTYSYCLSKNKFNCNGRGRWVKVGGALSATVKNLTPGVKYYWQVRATDYTGGVTDANGGTPWSFTVAPMPGSFSKVAPATGATNQPVNLTLEWTTSQYADHYEYCADTSNNNTCDTGWVNAGSGNSVAVSPNLLSSAVYYWQVRAVNASGSTLANYGTWWTFTTHIEPGVFEKIAPEPDATGQLVDNLYFSWTISDTATGYQYCLDTDSDSDCDSGWQPATPLTEPSVSVSGLSHFQDYYWQVKAIGPGGESFANGGSWWHFKTQIAAPADFSKHLPNDGDTNIDINPTLTWYASSGTGIQYEYCVDQTLDDLCDYDWTPVATDLSVTLADTLFYDTEYFWQVRAVNTTATVEADGNAWWSFITMPPPAPTSQDQSFDMLEDGVITARQLASSNTPALKVFYLDGPEPAGDFMLHENGTFDYTPPANYSGAPTFDFMIWDTIRPPAGPYTVTIHIAPQNDAPTLAAIGNQSVKSIELLTFTAVGNDADLPYGDALTYSLGSNKPAGAAIDPVTGVFTWTPVWSPAKSVYTFDVIVSDSTLPTHLTATRSVQVTVLPQRMILPIIRN